MHHIKTGLRSQLLPRSYKGWLIILSLSISLWASTQILLAHGVEILEKTAPTDGAVLETSPTEVALWFTIELQAEKSIVEVFDLNDNQVDDGQGGVDATNTKILRANLPPGLPDGVYRVHWSVVAAEDEDQINGMLFFGVGDIEVAPDVDTVAAAEQAESRRLWLYIAAFIVVIAIVGTVIQRSLAKPSSSE